MRLAREGPTIKGADPPLKKTLPRIIDCAVLAWMKKDDCFSYRPTSRAVLPTWVRVRVSVKVRVRFRVGLGFRV